MKFWRKRYCLCIMMNYDTWRQIIKNGMKDVRFQFDSNRMAREYYELLYKS